MRLRILAKAEKLPVIYRHRILALIKEALKESNQKYKEMLYCQEKPKPFTFSLLLPKEREQKREAFSLSDGIEIEDYVFYFPKDSFLSLLISSYDYEFLINLYNGLLKIKSFAFNKEITMNICGFYLQEDPKIEEDTVVFKTLSPILVEDKDGNPLLKEDGSFDEDLLNKELNNIQDKVFRTLKGKGPKRGLEFKVLNCKKRIVKHTNSHVLKNYSEGKFPKPYLVYTCLEGYLEAKGDPEYLRIIYNIGIGLRRGQGFGMVEVV